MSTPKAAHTPGPWFLAGNNSIGFRNRDSAGNIHSGSICYIEHDRRLYEEQHANADRIVNCVNALDGIPDPQTAIPKLIEALLDAAPWVAKASADGSKIAERLMRQIDDALAATRGETSQSTR